MGGLIDLLSPKRKGIADSYFKAYKFSIRLHAGNKDSENQHLYFTVLKSTKLSILASNAFKKFPTAKNIAFNKVLMQESVVWQSPTLPLTP